MFGLIVMGVRLASLMAQPKRSLVSFPPKKEKRKRGCRRLVAIHGRDGAAAAFRELFRTEDFMMRDGACASCASCVMVMTVNCGGDDGVLLMMVM